MFCREKFSIVLGSIEYPPDVDEKQFSLYLTVHYVHKVKKIIADVSRFFED